MLLQIVALVVLAIWYVALRPRKGGKNAPPTVTSSSVCRIPVVGVLVEFFQSPNTMVQRCVKDYGAVFTIPVRVGVCVCACCLVSIVTMVTAASDAFHLLLLWFKS